IAFFEHLLVADRRLQQVLVISDPFLEVEGLESSCLHEHSLQSQAAEDTGVSDSLRPHVSKARRVASFSASVSSSIGGRTRPLAWPIKCCQYFECAGGFSAGRVRPNASRTGLRLSRITFALAISPLNARSVYSRIRRSTLV